MDKSFFKKNLTAILIIAATLILGGVAVFTAIRLYQLRSEPVAPNAPESSPQAANEGVILTIPIDTVVRGAGEHILSDEAYPQYSGKVCAVKVTARNQESVHPGNDLRVSSGSDSVLLEDVENEANAEVVASGDLTLGDRITVTLIMGPDQLFSGGLDVELNCIDPTPTPTPTATPEPSLTSCTELVFSLSSATASASPTPTVTPTLTPTATPSPSASPTSTPSYSCNSTCTSNTQCEAVDSNYLCYAVGSAKYCRHEDYPDQTDCKPAGPNVPEYPCNGTCTSDSQCAQTDSNYICYSQPGSSTKTCRHEDYPTQTNCQPPASAAATATPATLPQAGVSAPTILGLGAGLLLLVVALAFAL